MVQTEKLEKLQTLGLFSMLLLFIAAPASYWFLSKSKPKSHTLSIAAGSQSGEAYAFAFAIQKLVHKHCDDVQINIVSTAGSEENMKGLAQGRFDLGMTQADIDTPNAARLVSVLYPDFYQIIVRQDSGIHSVRDLKGKRVALPSKGGGQWRSFWFLADHYGLQEADLKVVHGSINELAEKMAKSEIDALFRVRAVMNRDIAKVIRQSPVRFLAIDQAPAMHLIRPSCSQSFIPKGAYLGSPAIPAEDISTIVVRRLLVAHHQADPYAVEVLTRMLYERRRDLVKNCTLGAFTQRPMPGDPSFIPIHDGAQRFFNREKPSFFVEYADFVALLISLVLMGGSSIVGLHSFVIRAQKNQADEYAKRLVALTSELDGVHPPEFFEQKRQELKDMLAEVVRELDHDNMNFEGFNVFTFAWNLAYNELKEREQAQRGSAGAD